MREYDFDMGKPQLTAEQQEQLDEELARRVLDEVQHLDPQHTPSSEEEDEEDEDDESDAEQEEGEGNSPDVEAEPAQPRRRRGGLFWMFVSGNVLLWRGLTRYYGQMVLVAFLFLVSIIVMFWSLHLDMEYNILSRRVQLLRERSVRLQEVRSSRLSHSAIVKELEQRGIELYDPTTPATVIEKSGFWR
ncbi:MAG: hypothetical protein R3Y68_04205 [Rikenellaceae bacterium]